MVDRDDERKPALTPLDASAIDPDAPPSAEEALASSRLRDALASSTGGDPNVELARSLHAAWAPAPLDPDDHAAIIDDLPTSEELALANELRDALDPASARAAPELVVALRSAWSPAELGEDAHRAIVAQALAGSAPANVIPFRPRLMRVVVVSTTTALALAASVVVWLTTVPYASEAPLAKARSTQPLFGEPFRAGEASARIDKIAMARASDYRDNRFAKWGVR